MDLITTPQPSVLVRAVRSKQLFLQHHLRFAHQSRRRCFFFIKPVLQAREIMSLSCHSRNLGKAKLAAMLFFCLLLLRVSISIAEDYQIGSGDVLSITVFDHDELKTKVRVSETGSMEFPLIGTVQVGGIKTSEAAKKIESKLADGYIVKPQVQIYIEEFKSKKVAALGPFNKPGLIELNGPTTLLELISKAGGLHKEAGDTITVTRETENGQKIINIEVKKLIEDGDAASNIPILGGETVSVAKGEPPVCYITGQVKKPGSYPWTKNVTVLKIVSLAGGFTGMASESHIKITRIVDGKKQMMEDVSVDAKVFQDDVIEVPESFF